MSENPNPSLPQGDHHQQSSPGPYPPPHLQSMRLPGQIDDVPSHAIIPHEEPHEHHHHHHYDHEEGHINEIPLEVNVETMETVEGGTLGVMMAPGVGNQLTLSFQGEVYVFDSVSPEKVQAVLLLLGGRELTSGIPTGPPSSQPANKRSNFPQRVASLMRFREKRKERNFDKKIRYTVRKEVALRMHRNKGQFTSSKPKTGDANWDSAQQWSVDDRPQAASSCHHCGTNVSSTPMMRRGPDGPRTLCNACGLMWANKGTLRELSRSASIPVRNAALEQSMVDCNGSNGESLPVMHTK